MEEKLKKYIDIKKKENIKILDNETKPSKDELIKFIKKEKMILYGKSAIEVHMGLELTLPIYIIFSKSMQIYKTFFNKLNRKFKYAWDPISLTHRKTYIYNFRLVRYLYIYKINVNMYKKNKDGFIYTMPMISLADIYYMYSTPLYNSTIFEQLAEVEQKFLKSLDLKNDKEILKIEECNKCEKELCNKQICKTFQKMIAEKYIKNNKYILITGILALNNLLKTDYIDTIDLIISKNKLKSEFEKLSKIVKDITIKSVINKFHYFIEVHEVYLEDVHLLTYYITDTPFSYFKKHHRCNYHTILFMLIYKTMTTNNTKYLDYIQELLKKSKNKDVLKDTEYKCFQSTYIDESIKDFLLLKNKLVK
jgi:hypothetical protein